jgi:hypothetical protein
MMDGLVVVGNLGLQYLIIMEYHGRTQQQEMQVATYQ